MATAEPNAALFMELKKYMRQENIPKIIEVCNKIRSKVPNDPVVVKTKCVALIQDDKMDKALEMCSKYDFLSFERAYCYFRKKDFAAALEACESAPAEEKETPRFLYLRAQINYRLERFDESIDTFQNLLARSDAGSSGESISEETRREVMANLCATHATAGKGAAALATVDATEPDFEASYELGYNWACCMLDAGRLRGAEARLAQAEEACRSMLAVEGCSAEEVAVEASLVQVQRATVMMRAQRWGEAQALLKQVLRSKPGAGAAVATAIAANNLAAAREPQQDLFDSLKKMKAAGDAKGLSNMQRTRIRCNRALLLLHMGKAEEAAAAIQQAQEQAQEQEEDKGAIPAATAAAAAVAAEHVALIQAARSVALGQQQEAVGVLKEAVAASPSSASVRLRLTLAQLAASSGDYVAAVDELASLPSQQPATLACQVALLERCAREQQQQQEGGDAAAAAAAAAGATSPLTRAADLLQAAMEAAAEEGEGG